MANLNLHSISSITQILWGIGDTLIPFCVASGSLVDGIKYTVEMKETTAVDNTGTTAISDWRDPKITGDFTYKVTSNSGNAMSNAIASYPDIGKMFSINDPDPNLSGSNFIATKAEVTKANDKIAEVTITFFRYIQILS
jgi:hypothetical protein